jgi:phosphoribosylformylglycinamidine cyclo-ligase
VAISTAFGSTGPGNLMTEKAHTTYSQAGVDPDREHEVLTKLVAQIRPTWAKQSFGRVALDIGYFANVIDIGGLGIAITADGVGTKVLIAQMMDRYDTVGIDCVAMNVNDLLCVGATPVSMVDYLALDQLDAKIIEDIARGLAKGAEEAQISISGGEMAQIPDIITGVPGALAFDLAGMAIGTVPLDKILIGQDIKAGDAIIGIESHGIHSNGLSLARKVLFHDKGLSIHDMPSPLSDSLGHELLKPTYIYVQEALAILKEHIPVKAFIHITSDGFLNLGRSASPVGYIIEDLPQIPAIFSLIQEYGGIKNAEMFRVFNMGIGFCVIAPETSVDRIVKIVESYKKKAYRIGYIIPDKEKHVYIMQYNLTGRGKQFWEAEPERPINGASGGHHSS